MSPTTRLAPRLAVARIKMRSGAAWLDVLAVVSFALSTLIALTVAGGIWMFKTLNEERPAKILQAIGEDRADTMLTYYVLSVVAGALLVIPIFALGSSAARLGAQARARRLATLRLIGVTGSQTVRMALIETAAQWLIGAVAGVVLYYATLPAWSNASFFKVSIDTSLTKPATKHRSATPPTVRHTARGSSKRRRTASRRGTEEVFVSGRAAT